MGILNVNNESFYSGSRYVGADEVDARLQQMIAEGVDIVDIGACSTRPGSTPVTLEQEWSYLEGALELIAGKYIAGSDEIGNGEGVQLKISIDTFRSEIVRRAYQIIGPFIVNDISAGEDDKKMLPVVGELGLPYIAMHKRGTPENMQQLCDYPNGVVEEVTRYFIDFEKRAAECGITEYIIDPGFGFAKNLEQNYTLFKGMPQIINEIEKCTGKRRELLVGISRKGMLWKPLGITPDEALCATAAMNLQALLLGASIIRVHDVAQARQCVKLWEFLTIFGRR
jgi:dihydropteroate synthase